MATKAQILIRKYIDSCFHAGSVQKKNVGTDCVQITDIKGGVMVLTMNVFCDIMDAETSKIYAISNIPHDLDKVGTLLPTAWVELPR